ncbi:hypothetical protein [Bacillus thuringiensis]|uniref:Uncharacterized protein n=1 Tax=Bacillus thuringiensis TaxID=1428 RepID=A0A9X6WSP0_BACTU|nr:hypothetical protein [Bacillus thuringiensis]PFJ42762.1 hypothetical protein COJ15_05320 [Bacillus thuringiensis]
MKLLSKPSHFKFEKEKEVTNFKYFRLSPTERNWVGKTYITKKEVEPFFSELLTTSKEFEQIFVETDINFDISIFVDLSVFNGNHEKSEQILDFLEEIEDFYSPETGSIELENLRIKYMKKIKKLTERIENHAYLYRWYYNNTSHSFAPVIFEHLNEIIKRKGRKFVRLADKGMDDNVRIIKQKMAQKQKKQSLSEREYNRIRDDILDELVEKLGRTLKEENRKNFEQFFKFSFSEPSLLYFAVYSMRNYIKQIEIYRNEHGIDIILRKTLLLYIETVNHRMKCVFKEIERGIRFDGKTKETMPISNEMLINSMLEYETHLSSFINNDKVSVYPQSLYALKNMEDTDEREKIGVLKAIVEWAAERINQKANIFESIIWTHKINHPFFNDIGLNEISFLSQDMVRGPEGDELSILASGLYKDEALIYFPIFNPKSWEGLNSKQCALMAYGICLYHDMLNKENYKLIPSSSNRESVFEDKKEYELVLLTRNKDVLHKKNRKIETPKYNAQQKERTRSEHWVNFHFRKLKEGQSASEEARGIALKYGFKQIPKGFTFVDSFIRGDRTIDPSTVHVSAVDVLAHTLKKMDTVEKEISSSL